MIWSSYQEFQEYIQEKYAELVGPEGFEEAIAGLVLQSDGSYAIAYDTNRMVQILATANSWSMDDAFEWLEHHVLDATVPDGPCFVVHWVNAPEQGSNELTQLCGAQGFGLHWSDECPACEAQKKGAPSVFPISRGKSKISLRRFLKGGS
jgi:hypothetical protein